jgi:hypothetical protein
MAVFRTDVGPASGHEQLVNDFRQELARNRRGGQPYIFINDIGQTGTFHVTAVWDRWRGLTPQQRSKVIVEALNRYDPSTAGKITIAMGLSGAEARRMGILPYAVQVLLKRGEGHLRQKATDFLKEHGAFETDDGTFELLFRTEDAAVDAYSTLKEESPDLAPHLALAQVQTGEGVP